MSDSLHPGPEEARAGPAEARADRPRSVAGCEVLRKLCDGASAELFLARSNSAREQLILEVVRPELLRDGLARERIRREAQVRQRLRHPNLVRRVSGGGTPDGGRFFVTEPVGETLRALLDSRGPLSLAELVRLALPLCDALDCYHQNGLVHGNLKAASVCVTGVPGALVPKLIDCGLALFRSGLAAPRPPRPPVEPEYLAPERVAGRRATQSADLYGLGVLLYEALTGAPPFTDADPLVTRRKQLEQPPPRLMGPHAPLAPIVERCLAKAPSERYASALEVKRDLLALTDRVVSERDVLGAYRLVRLIGEGAMGRVFLARHLRLGRRVALKLLRPERAADGRELERFFREARAVNQVSHPHIVEVHDFVDELTTGGRRVYCVMELLEGQTLGELLRKGPVPLRRGLELARQVCGALEAAHAVGVVHRDVKPDNIFITQRDGADFVKVLDFGVAKLRGVLADEGQAAAASPSSTVAGTTVGTPCFMAPEQALARAVDHRVDVYALGVVLYVLLTGRRPFTDPNVQSLMRKVVYDAPPPLGEVTHAGEPIPPELARLVLSCLAKRPAERPKSMAELSRALEPFLAAPPASCAPRHRWAWAFPLAVLAGAAAALLIQWSRGESPQPDEPPPPPVQASPEPSPPPQPEPPAASAEEPEAAPSEPPRRKSRKRAPRATGSPAREELPRDAVLDPFDD